MHHLLKIFYSGWALVAVGGDQQMPLHCFFAFVFLLSFSTSSLTKQFLFVLTLIYSLGKGRNRKTYDPEKALFFNSQNISVLSALFWLKI